MTASPSGAGAGAGPLGARSAVLLAIASFGGPLALAALYAPTTIADVPSSAGLVAVFGVVAFVAPIAIWWRFSRDIASPGGLTAFVEAAAGRRVAVAHGLVWSASYVLYVLYTSAYVVHDVLPVAWPGVARWHTVLDLLLPVAVAGVVVAGRRAAVAVIGVLAVGQLGLLAMLDVVSVSHAPAPHALSTTASNADLAQASGGVATLFVCGSLPLFFGGDLGRAASRLLQRAIGIGFAVAAVAVGLALYPLAQDPAFTKASMPGYSLVAVDVGHAPAVALGIGVAGSIVAVMLLEYVALTRLGSYLTARSSGWWARVLAVPVVLAGPVSLLDPDRFYDDLVRPSLVLLWLAQIVVVLVFPLFTWRRGGLRAWHVVATAVGLAVMGFGLHATTFGSAAT